MKKVFALVLVAVMMMSVAAMAQESVDNSMKVISVEPATVDVAVADTDLVKEIAGAIADTGMGVFGEGYEDYTLLNMAEITVGAYDEADGLLTIQLFVPGVKAGDDVAVMLGLVEDSNVAWTSVEVVSVEENIVTIAVEADQAAAVQAGTALIAVLVK